MKIKITLISLLLFLFVDHIYSQATEEWVARYDSSGVDQLYDMVVDTAGNVYVTGASIQGSATTDFLTIKYNSSGVKQWEKVYNGTSDSQDRSYAITVDTSGNVYVTGSVGYDNSIVTIKYNSLGDSLWVRSYTGPRTGHNWTYPTSIFVDDSGYVYVTGSSEGMTGVHGLFQDYTTIKYSPLGVQKWVARHNGAGTDDDVINSMTVDASGNVYVTGYSGGGSTGSADSYGDITTIMYNSLGSIVWSTTFAGAGTSSDEGKMIRLDNLGNVYVTGTTYTSSGAGKDIVTIKYNAGGTELWTTFYNGPGSDADEGIALVVDSLHNVYVTGNTYYSSVNGFDMVTIKYDSLGAEQWDKNVNGSANGSDASEAIMLDEEGNIYVLGTTVNTTTAEDFQILKYNPAGTELWQTKYTNSNGVGNQEYAVALQVDEDNNVYAAGMSTLDFAVAKYSQATGMEERRGKLSFTIFPNPCKGIFSIKNGNTGFDAIEIYNLLGEKIYETSNLKPQTSNEIDLTNELKGIYFVKVIFGDQNCTKKIVIQ